LKRRWKNKKISKKGSPNKKDEEIMTKGTTYPFFPFVKAGRDEFPDLIKDKGSG